MAKTREYTFEEVHCPKCNATIPYYDMENSAYYGCASCKTFFEAIHKAAPKELRVFSRWNVKETVLQVGWECLIDAKYYLLVGIMHKKEEDDDFSWTEYVLWRKGEPYIIIVEAGADWLIVRKSTMAYEYTVGKTDTIFYDHKGYRCRLEMSYRFKITYAVGEFDWNILSEEHNMAVFEFFGHKKVYVHETMGKASDWYVAIPTQRHTIAGAFKIPTNKLPRLSSYGNVNLDNFEQNVVNVWIAAVLAIALIVTISLLKPERSCFATGTATQIHFDSLTNSYTSGPVNYPSFDIPDKGAVSVNISLPYLDNSWGEVSGTLVNDKTGETYDFTKSIEFYAGYEGGESWSEGSRDQEVLLSGIPAGKYHLNLNMYTEKDSEKSTVITVTENLQLPSNMIIAAIIILIYPVILLYKQRYYNTGSYFSD